MSRLETHIRRLQAQRACLDALARAVASVAGPVVELGLGNGRTYDHLRERLPEREIFVFERDPRAHPACIPDDRHLIVGDLEATLPHALDRLPAPAALVHSDIGTGDEAATARLAAWLATAIPPLLAPGGFVASDQPLDDLRLVPWPLPDDVAPGRYHLYRVGA
ncbi:MAG: class I SAM-dependent methyltransferase [Pseudomonadota bacterium]